MYKYLSKLSFLALMIFSISVSAEILNKDAIPEKIKAQLAKRHPDAVEITAEKKVHFAQELYEVFFSVNKEKIIELYRPDGHFYAKAQEVQSIFLMVPGSEKNLKAAFNDVVVKESIMVANPNSSGEEYDLLITSGGKNWSVIVDGNGNVVKKSED
jgi:hypothetical protein